MAEHTARPAIAAGRFYPDDAGLLLRQIEACYTHPLGPYAAKGTVPDRPTLALIVPHGALGHAGPVTAHAFACLEYWSRQTGVFPKLVVLIGPDHLGLGVAVSATRQNYATPLGCLPTALAWVDGLCTSAKREGAMSWLAVSEAGHSREHALENVLPFLQHRARAFGSASANNPPPWNLSLPELLPLTVAAQDFDTAERLGALLDSLLPREGTLLIATSDLCHCGPWYGNEPAPGESREAFCRGRLERVAEVLQGFDAKQLVETYHREAWSLCGVAALAATLTWVRLRGGSRVYPLMLGDSVAIAQGWNDHPSIPRDGSGTLLYPWNLLTGVDPHNPVGFGSFALV
jgi:AmmeMemoRadiSam system protein B